MNINNNTLFTEALNEALEPELDAEISSLDSTPHTFSADFDKRAEKLTGHRRRRSIFGRKPALVTAAVIAAAVMTATAGAAVYRGIADRKSAAAYGLTGSEITTEPFEPQTVENEHLRFTNDIVMSDGKFAGIMFTVTPLDEQGKDLLYLDDDYDTSIPLLRWSEDPSALDRFDLDEYHTMGSHFERAEGSDAVVLLARLELSQLTGSSITVKLEDSMEPMSPLTDGLKLTIPSLEKNLPTRELSDGEGHSVTLSPIGFFSDEGIGKKAGQGWLQMSLTFNSGETKEFLWEDGSSIYASDDIALGFFAEVIDISEADTLTVNGINFR